LGHVHATSQVLVPFAERPALGFHAGMAPKYYPTPVSGSHRKALAKELTRAHAMTSILARLAAETRAAGEAMIREADGLLCQSWNERMWADGEPVDPSPTVDQAINGGGIRGLRSLFALPHATHRRPCFATRANYLRPRPRGLAAVREMPQGWEAAAGGSAATREAATAGSGRNPMSELTRRRDTSRNEETWLIFLDDVHIGHHRTTRRRTQRCRAMGLALRHFRIARRRVRVEGTAVDFDQARSQFEATWRTARPSYTEADFADYRRAPGRHGSRQCGRRAASFRRKPNKAAHGVSAAPRLTSRVWMGTSRQPT
jgi:hypothetical protein